MGARGSLGGGDRPRARTALLPGLHGRARHEDAGEGNIDHLVSGRTGVFLVESKYRRYHEPHLRKARRQAAKVHDGVGVWVTPVICLDQRSQKPFKTQGVWVLGRDEVVGWIGRQRNPPADRERLARFVRRP